MKVSGRHGQLSGDTRQMIHAANGGLSHEAKDVTANQFRAALDRLGLSQLGAARLFGVSDKTARNWAREGVDGTVVILLRLLVAGKITLKDIEKARG